MHRLQIVPTFPAGQLHGPALLSLGKEGTQLIVGRDGVSFVFDGNLKGGTILQRQSDAEQIHIFSIVVVEAEAKLRVPAMVVQGTAIWKGMEIAMMLLVFMDFIGEVHGNGKAVLCVQDVDLGLIFFV